MRSSKISSVTWPPPASSAQWPALAAAATILASTVVGVMPASRIGERPVSRVNLVDSFTEPSGSVTARRRVARPRLAHLGHGADGEQVALPAAGGGGHDADAEAADDRRGEPGQDVAGAEVEDPAGAGLVQVARSRRPSRPGARGWPRPSRAPVRRRGRRLAAQSPTMSMASASRGVWKPTSTWTRIEHRARTPRRRESCSCARPLPSR